MASTLDDASWPMLRRTARTVLVVDLVESVRLYQVDEAGTVRRWQAFVAEVVNRLLPSHGGRLVKSLGDGLMLEFEVINAAMHCAIDMHQTIAAGNAGVDSERWLWLRAGAHVADVYFDEHDIYGAGVNLAARLMTVAERGQTVVSASVRAALLPGVDPDAEDLGEIDLKGIEHPVRAFRIGAATPFAGQATADSLAGARAVIVVLPIEVALARDDDSLVAGDILTDDLIVGLSASPHWSVISRLSAMALRGRRPTLELLRDQLHATYVLSGRCVLAGHQLRVTAELAEVAGGGVLWGGDARGGLDDLLAPANPLAAEIVSAASRAIAEHEIRRARALPLPTLRSHSLLCGAIGLMHRLSQRDFERARDLLDHLAERHPRAPEPRAWQAKWHVLGITQGWGGDASRQAGLAHDNVQRALDRQADHALALAIDGLIAGFLNGDLETSETRYRQALEINPSESFAWLFMSALHAYRDRGNEAVQCAQTAIGLSPLDPVRYFFDSFLANALLAAGRLEESITVGQRSVRANCTHMPTYRSLAIAQVLSGQVEAARQTVQRLLQARPGYSLQEFRARYAGRTGRHAARYEEALRTAGLPDH